jgi:hypothetical protein
MEMAVETVSDTGFKSTTEYSVCLLRKLVILLCSNEPTVRTCLLGDSTYRGGACKTVRETVRFIVLVRVILRWALVL